MDSDADNGSQQSTSYKLPRKPVTKSTDKISDQSSMTNDSLKNQPVISLHEPFLVPDLSREERYVKWGIAMKTPLLIILWTLVGFGFAVGHHLYYQSLNGTPVGSSSKQNWALRFGTAFAFMVIASLRAACSAAYQQYIWTLFKRKSFSLDTLDKLFSMTSDPLAFLSWKLFKHAKLALCVAAVCWLISLAGIAPPATLSVVADFNNETKSTSQPALDWTLLKFVDDKAEIAQPSSEVLQIATLSAESMAIIPPTPPAANSSYRIKFFGPTVQCSAANSSQQSTFDYYSRSLANGSFMTLTKALFESGEMTWGSQGPPGKTEPLMNVYSAFSPYAGTEGWFANPDYLQSSLPDEYNNWGAELPDTFNSDGFETNGFVDTGSLAWFTTQQLWVQTADQALVCTLGNASFDVQYEFVDAALTVADYIISMYEPFWMPCEARMMPDITEGKQMADTIISVAPLPAGYWDPTNSYMAIFLALSSLLNGNVSITLTDSFYNMTDNLIADQGDLLFDGNVTIYDDSSKILQHGLSACDDFVQGYWNGNNTIGIGSDGPVLWQDAAAVMYANWSGSTAMGGSGSPYDAYYYNLGSQRFSNISNNLFTKPAWMCRNRTLLRAIEDLANNITISMLSSKTLAAQNATTIDVLYFPTRNVYKYDSTNLIISYSVATLFAIFCAVVGFFALIHNGVAHSNAFSAIIATTRNRDLDAVSKGHSLGAMPLEYTGLRLRFGELIRGAKEDVGAEGSVDLAGGEGERHIGFGIAERVLGLRKGGKYV